MDPVSSSILGPVCQRLLDAALKEYKLVRDVKEEIKKLCYVVRAVRDVLQDAERKKVADAAVDVWLKDLKQLLLDAEDVLDEIATDEDLRAKRDVRGTRSVISLPIFRSLSCLCSVGGTSSSRAIAHQIKDINKRFDHITSLKNQLSLHHLPGETSSSMVIRPRRPETSSVLRSDAHIIGRGEDLSRMRNLLLEVTCGERSVDVICVVGMGGIGKTTLVQHVYNDPEVTKCFDMTKWVCVSNDFDAKRITGEIMGEKEGIRTSGWDAAQVGLRDKIQGKRFLLVLDDVWEEGPLKWEVLYDPLSHGAKGSKIVITTRSQIVSTKTKGTPILLKNLCNDDLWSIFQKYAFDGHDPKKSEHLVDVGWEIVEKLKGSPLAAKTIGRLLNSKFDINHWKNIMKSEALLDVSKEDPDSIKSVLKLSYDHLPTHLKQCFAYCSLFPEDHEFRKDELVRLWMAQHFIDDRQGSHLENVGEEYFDYLVDMSFFERRAAWWSNKYVMHDLIHELTSSVSKDDCLVLIKDGHHKLVTSSETIRHISIINPHLDARRLLRDLSESYKKLRTLLFARRWELQLSRDHLDILFTNLPRLRVLGLSLCNIKELPKSIGNLKYLRYLDLSHNNIIQKLPESLCDLHKLQVLDLRDCGGWDVDLALPEKMSALINLRHLLTGKSAIASGIRGLGKLTCLHELNIDCRRSSEQPTLKALQDMNMLRQLEIYSLEEVKSEEEAKAARLHEKKHLETLKLRWREDRADHHRINPELERQVLDGLRPTSGIRRLSIVGYGGIRSPCWMEDTSWVCPFNSLETIEIEDCRNWEVLPPLGRLRCLQIARSSPQQLKTLLIQCPSLQELHIENCPQLMGFGGDDGGDVGAELEAALLNLSNTLRHLQLWYCNNLRSLPPKLRSLSSLESLQILKCPEIRRLPVGGLPESVGTLDIYGCHEELVQRCVEGEGSDWPLISHIPRRDIW